MRSAKENLEFPYSSSLICYFEVRSNGEVEQIGKESAREAYVRATDNHSKIFAVWPGNWRSDLFVIDDLNAFADAFDIPRPDDHIHDITWRYSSCDDGKSLYADIDIVFRCGCSLTVDNIKKFARDMSKQLGWVIATSKGLSCYRSATGTEYSISVRRSSIN